MRCDGEMYLVSKWRKAQQPLALISIHNIDLGQTIRTLSPCGKCQFSNVSVKIIVCVTYDFARVECNSKRSLLLYILYGNIYLLWENMSFNNMCVQYSARMYVCSQAYKQRIRGCVWVHHGVSSHAVDVHIAGCLSITSIRLSYLKQLSWLSAPLSENVQLNNLL